MMMSDLFHTFLSASIVSTLSTIFILTLRTYMLRRLDPRSIYAIWMLVPVSFLATCMISFLPEEQGDPDLILWEGSLLTHTKFSKEHAEILAPSLMSNIEMIDPSLLALILWGIMTVILGSIAAFRQQYFYNTLIKSAMVPNEQMVQSIGNIARKLNLQIVPEVRISDRISGPLVSGVQNPTIYLPQNFNTDYSMEERYIVLLHEAMHIRRSDLWFQLIAVAMRLFQWPNPIFHYAYGMFLTDQEAACDADVIEYLTMADNRYVYGKTLAKVAQNLRRYPTGPIVLNAAGSLRERLHILQSKGIKIPTLSIAFIGTAMIAGLSLILIEPPSKADPFFPSGDSRSLVEFLSTAAARDDREIFILQLEKREGFQARIYLYDVGDVENLGELGLTHDELALIVACNHSAPLGKPVDAILMLGFQEKSDLECLRGYDAGNMHSRLNAIHTAIENDKRTYHVLPSLRTQVMPDI